MIKTKLAVAIAGAVLSIGATNVSASITMYNTFTTTDNSKTDGWTRIADTNGDGYGTGPESQGNKGLILPWAGSAGTKLPFDYVGSSHLNWAVALEGKGDSAEISGSDSMARYGFAAEIDTGGGAWRDNSDTPTGWKHQTDIGLISSDVTQVVHLNLTALGQQQENTFSTFGVTVFEGMDLNTDNYSHHGSWNCPSCTTPKPYSANNPFKTIGLTTIGWNDSVDAVNDFIFKAEAGKIYSVYLGGVDFSKWNTAVDNYKLDITTSDMFSVPPSAVPVPGAVWLFGSAIVGMVSFSRRKSVATV